MKKHFLLTAISCFWAIMLWAQQGVSGVVKDTINKQPLHMAVIALLNAKDSVLIRFTRTDNKGTFAVNDLPQGKYILKITYPNYVEFADFVEVPYGKMIAIPEVSLVTKAKLLEEVIVKQKVAAIRMRGDTIEYKADSFKVDANANVQELLKRLPGIQVNGKGEIVAQGQKVERILVDGEEFFSDDPAVVAQNLRADAVDKLQVFDKKSDQAAFTGIDDGEKSRTINVELKESAKKGYFGKLEGSTDFDQYYRAKLLFNAFKAKRKIAGYVTTDNTQFQSLNWNEREKYSTDADRTTVINDDGSMYMYSNGDEWSSGQGLPQAINAGLMFGNKWNKDKNNINLNYQLNDQRVSGFRTNTTQTILPDTSFVNTSRTVFNSNRQRNRVFGTYEYTIDSTSSLKATAKSNFQRSDAFQRMIGESISEEGSRINTSDRITRGKDENNLWDANIFYRKRFKKAGRTMSVNIDLTGNNTSYNGYLEANNIFFDKTGNQVLSNVIDQNKTSRSTQTTLTTKATYTEPLWKQTFLELNYSVAINRNDAERNTYERSVPGGKYDRLIDSLSNHFIFNTMNNSGGVNFRYTGKKVTASLGSQIGRTTFDQEDLRLKTTRSIFFNNFLPQASIEWRIKKQRRFNLSYRGSNTNPTLAQIQPLIDNSDPLNITIGNPNLKQAFNHNFNLNFSDYKVLRSRNIYISAYANFTDNAITNANTIDTLGRRVNQTVNVNGNYNIGGYLSYGFDVAPSINLNISYNPSINRFVNIINQQQNITDNQAHSFEIYSGYWGDKWINYWMNMSATYNISKSSINNNTTTRYWSYSMNPNATMKLTKKWILTIDATIDLYQRTEVFANQRNIFYVSSNIKRLLGKKDQLELTFGVNDIFNQYLGFRRNINTNFISENTWQTVRRYALLTVGYNFNKSGAQK
jgi:ligand-binding SRPBCC domain-containing protein